MKITLQNSAVTVLVIGVVLFIFFLQFLTADIKKWLECFFPVNEDDVLCSAEN